MGRQGKQGDPGEQGKPVSLIICFSSNNCLYVVESFQRQYKFCQVLTFP